MTDRLKKAALAACKNSYSPYSGYKTGAAVLAESGNIYTGSNVENASYGATVCAERAAVLSAVSSGERAIKEVAVAAEGAAMPYPCGMCLQVLAEFCAPETPITVIGTSGTKRLQLKDLISTPFKL